MPRDHALDIVAPAQRELEPDPLRQPGGGEALPQHVLHRLPEAEIDAERKGGDELSQSDRSSIGRSTHLVNARSRGYRNLCRDSERVSRRVQEDS